ncbi:3451_t:CDS:10 [Paraglomus brasilianum]|uniref:Needs CLA4 to survive protein 3 n=1 Tax=Paraglomus brasilianum TaxID=144538 RepID=A0A9N9FX88_9GLOM|nr:3451_t:CDS:10 [Paraglomus brasilianum]
MSIAGFAIFRCEEMGTIAENQSLEAVLDLNRKLNKEVESLKSRVIELEEELALLRSVAGSTLPNSKNIEHNVENSKATGSQQLSLPEYLRYGRQLILPGFGLPAQLKLRSVSILIVGAGGLGAPAAMYLAAAGVGHLGIVDYDNVETSNLQRQVIHSEFRQGLSKAYSAKMSVERYSHRFLTPDKDVNHMCIAYNILLDSSNALKIIKAYDIIVDATDNVATRYLLNDACVITGKPLVSGSALRMDGQLTVYNYKNGPCYRCLFPKPPPPETVVNCSDGGVLGAVTGVIGSLQALLAIKIAVGMDDPSEPHNLLIFSANSYPPFRSIKLRGRKKECAICGDNPTIKELQDYVQFCGSGALDKSPETMLLTPEERIDPKTYHSYKEQNIPHLLLDIRDETQFGICSLPESLNIPLSELPRRIDEVKNALPSLKTPVYVICRRGNDSQPAVRILKEKLQGTVKDIIGGLHRWATDVDESFPIY